MRRQLGKKVLECGGNAVLAYHQQLDVEGDSGIVARSVCECAWAWACVRVCVRVGVFGVCGLPPTA